MGRRRITLEWACIAAVASVLLLGVVLWQSWQLAEMRGMLLSLLSKQNQLERRITDIMRDR